MKTNTNPLLLWVTVIGLTLAVAAVSYWTWPRNPESETKPKEVPAGFKDYEDGKHRRYELLFAVNGAVLALAKLLTDKDKNQAVGNLTLPYLAMGMILFTIIMVVDIFMFGYIMRKNYVPDQFGPAGKTVLVTIGLLICLGWFLVAWNYQPFASKAERGETAQE